MNDIAEQMKAQVSAMMQGEEPKVEQPKQEVQENGSNNANAGVPDIDNSNVDSGSGDNGQNVEKEELSERDQFEFDKALSSGWKKPDEFKGSAKDFIEPREWNRTVALYKRIDRESNERVRLQKEVESFSDRVKNVMEVAKANAITELESKKKDAVESADYDEVKRLDTEITKTNEDYDVEAPKAAQQTIRPEVEDWMEQNSWFEKDKDMTGEALDFQRAQLMKLEDPNNPSAEELSSALKKTSNYIKFTFPDKFKQQPRHVANSLERGSLKSAPKKFTYNDLSAEEKKVISEIERLPGGMSRDEYVQAVADMRETK